MPGKDLESRVTTRERPTCSRTFWTIITWTLTWWIPTPILKLRMKRADIRQAWREKVAIFIIIMMACLSILFFIIMLPRLICPKEDILGLYDIENDNTIEKARVAAFGRIFDVTEVMGTHLNKLGYSKFQLQEILGKDVSQMFYPTKDWNGACPGITDPGASWDNFLKRDPERYYPHIQVDSRTNKATNYLGFLAKYQSGRVGWRPEYIAGTTDTTKKLLIINNNVYDVNSYFEGQTAPGFFDENMYKIFSNAAGRDATPLIKSLMQQDPVYYRNVINCMDRLFYIGVVDNRNSVKCQLANWILYGASIVIVAVIGIKFLAALRSIQKSNPDDIDKYVIVQVPCYTEGKDSLELTFQSIAKTSYDDSKKLIMVICDGNITGGGNDKPTPRIALEVLYGDDDIAEEQMKNCKRPSIYFAVGEGKRAENKGQVYSGIYEFDGHRTPFIVVVKTGTDNEKSKPGNRGKRDSQILLMRFLYNIYNKLPLTELEYDLYHHMADIRGIDPMDYEYILMVDADTAVYPDSLTKMVSSMMSNKKIIGLCGETFVANEKDNWVTMIQVYEYFISHHLAKAFESLFGSVTCLPGCFTMYRIRTSSSNSKNKGTPLLISKAIIDEYSDPNVNTLHKKNLLSLGEDRYLTTLILKHFPRYQTTFNSDAQCQTNTPDDFNVLLSQRRRWINSTIHNLVELTSLGGQLCGFLFFSMRFIVILDLVSTIVAPASVVYVVYLIFSIITEKTMVPTVSLLIIVAIYGFQVIIFILKQKWEHIMWMCIYILAMPIFSFILPIYSFWRMDDFNWGNTRVVINGGVAEEIKEGDDEFDEESLPRKKLATWQTEFEDNENIENEKFDHHHDLVYAPPTRNVAMSMNNFPQNKFIGQHHVSSSVVDYVSHYYPPPPASQYSFNGNNKEVETLSEKSSSSSFKQSSRHSQTNLKDNEDKRSNSGRKNTKENGYDTDVLQSKSRRMKRKQKKSRTDSN